MSNDSAESVQDSKANESSNDSVTESSNMDSGTPSSSATSTKTSSNSSPDENEPISSTDTRRRVKLYMLNANRTWDDRGTGHVFSSYVDRLNGMSLLVKAETDGSTLLESKILADTAYQKQQDTLIVWSEGDNYDLALSFQERVGCEEIWAKICQVQGKDPSVEITQDLIEDDDNDLPPIEVDRLDEINSIIASSLTIPSKKESITLALENDSYILKLLQLFRQLEEKKDVPSLQKMYEIFKNIFQINRNSLFEIMLSEVALWDVIGVFEYDPAGVAVREANSSASTKSEERTKQSSAFNNRTPTSQTSNRALSSNSNSYFSSLPPSSESELMRLVREKRHREFLRNVSRFKEVIPLSKSELVSKIHQTYRVQYIQDVILPTPSVFEENMLSTLSSVLFFNKIEIVTLIQEDEKFLKELFRQLADDAPSFKEKRRDLVLFLKELCTFSHTLQSRELFIKTLSSLGLLPTIELLLSCDDSVIKLGAVDILTYIVDYSPSMVREYALLQENSSDKAEQYMINIIIEQMICDTDPDLGMATQLSSILKLLIDPENMLTTAGMNKTEKSEFLNYFYKHCMYFLTAPILAATVSNNTVEHANDGHLSFEQSCQSAQLLAIILELLTFCIEHHAYHVRSYLLQKDIVHRIMVLTKSKHTFLVLTVIRFMRRLVGLKDEFYNRHIVSSNLFAPIIDAFLGNKGRYNLLDSAVIDLFEFIHTNNIHTLSNYTMENFWKGKLERIDYVRTFRCIRTYYEQQNLRERLDTQTLMFSRNRFRRDQRQLEKEEDMWFNTEDDEEEEAYCADDDEDEDECENYNDLDDDSPPPAATGASTGSSSGTNRLLNDSTGIPFHHYVLTPTTTATATSDNLSHKPQLSSTHSSSTNTTSSPMHHHPLNHSLSSLHHHQQVSSTTTSISSYNQTTSSSNNNNNNSNNANSSSSMAPSGHHLSNYDTASSTFVESPFFSFFSSSGKKKLNERKTLTINLNSKTSSFIASGGNNNTSASSTAQQNVLSAFSAGISNTTIQTSSTSSIGANVLNHHSSSFVSKSFISSTANSTSSSNVAGQAIQSNDSLSRKALVDYPDEDSDEEEEEEEEVEDDDEEILKRGESSSTSPGTRAQHTNARSPLSKVTNSNSLSASTSGTSVESTAILHDDSSNVDAVHDSRQNEMPVTESNPVVHSSELEETTESNCLQTAEPSVGGSDGAIQSRTLSSCGDLLLNESPKGATGAVTGDENGEIKSVYDQQHLVSSSKVESVSSSHTTSNQTNLSTTVSINTVSGDDGVNANHSNDDQQQQQNQPSCTSDDQWKGTTNKRRLSDDYDDESKVTMSDENVAICTGSSDSGGSSPSLTSDSSSSSSNSNSSSCSSETSNANSTTSSSKRFKYSFVESDSAPSSSSSSATVPTASIVDTELVSNSGTPTSTSSSHHHHHQQPDQALSDREPSDNS